MPLFRGEVHTADFDPGEVIEIDADQVHLWADDVEAGFLTPLHSPSAAETTVGTPGAEELSTVGDPLPASLEPNPALLDQA